MPIISPTAISPHRIGGRGGIDWSSYWTPLNFVIEGHSFAAVDTAIEAFSNDTINYAYTVTAATGGATMATINARAAAIDAMKRTGHRNIMLLWIGANDIQAEGDGAIFYAALKSYVQDRIAAGWTVFCYTTTPVNDARAVMFEVERDISNELMRSDLALLDRVYILDTDTITELDDASDVTYYHALGVHLQGIGSYLANQLFKTSLDTASSGAAIKTTPTTLDFTVTTTGTAAGISTLSLLVDGWSVLTLDGNAKFYTNAGATECETDKWVIGSSIYSHTIYIKSSGGASNLRVLRHNIKQFAAWTSSTDALTLAGNITQLTGITRLHCRGLNTISGDISLLPLLDYIFVEGTNTLSGSIAGLVDLTFVQLSGSNTVTGSIAALTKLVTLNIAGSSNVSGSIAALTLLQVGVIAGANTITGSVSNLTALKYFDVRGSNTLSGSIDALTSLTYLMVTGSNTISGDVKNISEGITRCWLQPNRIDTYTTGGNWGSIGASNWIYITPSSGYGLSVAELILLISDINTTKVAGRAISIVLTGSNASMADTAQGGIWGDFDGETSPSALATAYKNLVKTDLCTLTLNGIVAPGATGDGTGFPTGFGDWYRS